MLWHFKNKFYKKVRLNSFLSFYDKHDDNCECMYDLTVSFG